MFIAIFISGLTIAIILNPKESLDASLRGLTIWWEVVFPSLLPFFIVSELLIGFGVVRFIGVLLEPLMRPVFRVPGVGGFVWAMGMASGNPAGAKLTARMRQEKQLTKIQAERLVSFTSSSNPLFIFGAVAVGFFDKPSLGILLAAAHYLGNLCVGLTMRFYGKSDDTFKNGKKRLFPSPSQAFKELHSTRVNETRPLGKMLGDAVISSIQTLLMIGGFIILFSVFNKILAIIHVTQLIGVVFSGALSLFHIASDLSVPLITGIFEITLGNQLVSETNASLLEKVMIASFILAFGGLSIQAQVASILADTDIRFKPFFIARILQGIYSSIIAFLLFKPIYLNLESFNTSELPVMLMKHGPGLAKVYWEMIVQSGPLITIISLLFYIFLYSKRNVFTKTS
ncbi:sporulation integral membrane protein YlbJ [Metabacillus halosaccharovorans]|uniref:Sporulation integral membrane protein YlbJ n=1 Tax=Metabacillus halosaccharovorans TaxID=930124 RepID=A0ABT3DKH7_9BACI|nr:sporulation integral membrane protein YlbJ [Metabacillus halosaccharovorans]MCV9887540.1 sporulation integral membrane protein YlbJ [Metabacillus halosaccharovorans]